MTRLTPPASHNPPCRRPWVCVRKAAATGGGTLPRWPTCQRPSVPGRTARLPLPTAQWSASACGCHRLRSTCSLARGCSACVFSCALPFPASSEVRGAPRPRPREDRSTPAVACTRSCQSDQCAPRSSVSRMSQVRRHHFCMAASPSAGGGGGRGAGAALATSWRILWRSPPPTRLPVSSQLTRATPKRALLTSCV